MSILQRYENNDGIELVIDQETQEIYYPGYRALARVCSLGLDKVVYHDGVKRTIDALLKGGVENNIQSAEILTGGGLQGGVLIPLKLGTQVIKKYNFPLYEKMADAGHALYLMQLVGYTVKVQQPNASDSVFLEAILNRLDRIEKDAAVGREYNSFVQMQSVTNPGLVNLMNGAGSSLALPPVKQWLTAAEWALKKGYALSQQQKSVLSTQAAAIYKNFKGKNPSFADYSDCYVYSTHEEYILEHAMYTAFNVTYGLVEEIQSLEPKNLIDICKDCGIYINPKDKFTKSLLYSSVASAVRNEELPSYCRYSPQQYYPTALLKDFLKMRKNFPGVC
jgi:hypothetical protein